MPSYTASPLTRQHSHNFDQGNPLGEKNAKLAMLLTLAMMVLEITAGYYFNSMALLADGWHISSHALALGLSVSAYAAARKLANYRRFSFGTWQIEILYQVRRNHHNVFLYICKEQIIIRCLLQQIKEKLEAPQTRAQRYTFILFHSYHPNRHSLIIEGHYTHLVFIIYPNDLNNQVL